jgi:hypothetical protein
MAPKSSLSATAYNRSRPQTAGRPAARPAAARPTAQRPTSHRPTAQRVATGSRSAEPAPKKSMRTTMLVIVALVAGAILAFAVLT